MLTMVFVLNIFKYGLSGILLFLDAIVYYVAGLSFSLFESLARFQFSEQIDYQGLAEKFYVVIGVAALFFVTYSLLKSIINPDDLNKNVGKIAGNLIVSIILLGIVPLIFSYAFQIQNAILDDNIIGNLVLGNYSTKEGAANTLSSEGNKATLSILKAFLSPKDGADSADTTGEDSDGSEYTWSEFEEEANSGDAGAFLKLTAFAEPVHDGDFSYLPIVSTICGVFLIYVLISFSLDLGVRVIKLAFYQIIAPIPILLRIIPEKKSVFDNWVKACIATFMEVFIRLFIMFIVVYLATFILDETKNLFSSSSLNLIGKVIVVLGFFAFAKQAPKLLSDVMGIDSGNIKLGIGGKLAAGGAFTAGAILGGGLTAGVRNLTHGVQNFQNAQGFGNKAKALGRTIASTPAGIISGGVRSGVNGWSAKNTKDMRNAASKGATATVNKRNDRETFRASYGSGPINAIKGRASETGRNISNWATGGSSNILNKVSWEEQFKNLYNDYQALYENPTYNAMDAELQKIKGLQAAGVTTYEGQNIGNAIKNLEGQMLEKRLDAIRGNKQSAAYAMYNIAQMARKSPDLAKSIGIDVSMAKDLVLRGGEILDTSTGQKVTADKLYSMIEGSSLSGITYDSASKEYKDSLGNVANLVTIANSQAKDGMKHQKKKASDAAKADKVSIAYKEAQKRQEESKK